MAKTIVLAAETAALAIKECFFVSKTKASAEKTVVSVLETLVSAAFSAVTGFRFSFTQKSTEILKVLANFNILGCIQACLDPFRSDLLDAFRHIMMHLALHLAMATSMLVAPVRLDQN